ncbi:hypothetical protein HJ057_16665 [Vibrio parahaemolyticus]|nr:hypothetical protein [Vibrio parahaemolyticus]
MDSLIDTFVDDEIENIIYAGVGFGEHIPNVLNCKYRNLLLIEADSDAADYLERYSDKKTNIKNCAVNNTNGRVEFTKTKPSRYSSISKNININNVLKNASVESQFDIDSVTISDVVSELMIQDSDKNILILCLNGREFDVINSVSINDLSLFYKVIVQITKENIYSSNELGNINKLTKNSLLSKGFVFEDEDQSDAFFVNYLFSRNDSMLKLISENSRFKNDIICKNKELVAVLDDFEKLKNEKIEIEAVLNNIKLEIKELEEINKKTNFELVNKREDVRQLEENNIRVNKDLLSKEQRILQLEERINNISDEKSSLESENKDLMRFASKDKEVMNENQSKIKLLMEELKQSEVNGKERENTLLNEKKRTPAIIDSYDRNGL